MTEAELRLALQRCQSRVRLARAALEAFRMRFLELAGPLPITDAAELIAMADGIRDLLTNGEVQP